MASSLLQARRQRVHLIRRRVVGAGTAIFLATTGGIFVQLVSGHDPALARSQTTTHASTSGASVASGSSPSSGLGSADSSSSGSSSVGSSSSSGSATAVTTSAS